MQLVCYSSNGSVCVGLETKMLGKCCVSIGCIEKSELMTQTMRSIPDQLLPYSLGVQNLRYGRSTVVFGSSKFDHNYYYARSAELYEVCALNKSFYFYASNNASCLRNTTSGV